MKAAFLKQYSNPLVVEDVSPPCAGPGEVLVRVKACGICGTDLKVWRGDKEWVKLPLIMGHEIAGEIAAVGADVDYLHLGERGVVHFFLTCGRCEFCLAGNETLCDYPKGKLGFSAPGGLAEYVVAPANNFIPIPDDLSFVQAAIVCDAIATPYRALAKAAIMPGDCVLVVGLEVWGFTVSKLRKCWVRTWLGLTLKSASWNLPGSRDRSPYPISGRYFHRGRSQGNRQTSHFCDL